jgi:hypothetical protein
MEDILDLYCLPYDPDIPLVCMDEQPRQLIEETRRPLPAVRGKPQRVDYEYERNGTANIFMFTEPRLWRGWRHVSVPERKTSVDWAQEIQELLEVHYPKAPLVRLVCDNLNAHKIGSLYEALEPKQARLLAGRLEIHYTPKHGSWLNIAEIELTALSGQCLKRRTAHIAALRSETQSWGQTRNEKQEGVDWQFTTDDARIKLKNVYPQFQP